MTALTPASRRQPIGRLGLPIMLIGMMTLAGLAAPIVASAQQSTGGQLPNGLGAASGSGAPGLGGLLSSSKEPPVIKVQDPVYDFGTVFQGAQVKHTFKITNQGPGVLTIGAPQTSCGCTVAQPTRRELRPGEASEIAATFDTSADKGPAERIITFATNDPKQQQVSLTIKGDVRVKVDANPSPLVFQRVKQGVEESRQVTLSDLSGGRDFKITSIINSNPHLRVTQAARADGRPGAELTVTVLKSMPAASFSDVVKIATTVAPLNLPVSGTVLGDINATPPQVSFGILRHNAGAIRIARVKNDGERPVNILGVTSNNQKVTAAVQPITPGKEYRLTVELSPNSPDGTLRGVVAIKTDDPAEPLLEVPFYGIIGGFSG